jgi:hypothetical protein
MKKFIHDFDPCDVFSPSATQPDFLFVWPMVPLRDNQRPIQLCAPVQKVWILITPLLPA